MIEKMHRHFPLIALGIAFMFSLSPADQLDLIGSIPSQNGLYYTTMSPNGDYLAMGDQRSPGAGVDIVDINNPAQMTLAGTVHTGHMTYQLDWAGDYIYCPASWDGLYIYNASDLSNITPVFDTSLGQPVASVAVRNGIALVGGLTGLYTIDITDPYHPVFMSHQSEIIYFRIMLGDTLAYAFLDYTQILFINISDPAHPFLVSTFNCPDVDGIDIDEANNRMFLVSQNWDLRIYDIRDIEHPALIGQTSISGWCIDVDYSSEIPDRVFVSAYTQGLWAVDITDPSHPTPTAHYMSSLWSCYVLVYKDMVYNTIADSLQALNFEGAGLPVDDDHRLPENLYLSQNYPNPFNSSTVIEFSLPTTMPVILEIYNIIGQKISILYDGTANPGTNSVNWDASGFPSGRYFYRLSASGLNIEKPMTLLK